MRLIDFDINKNTIENIKCTLRNNKEIHIPSRIIYGFSVDKIDKIAFDILVDKNDLIITNFIEDCDFYLLENGEERLYGKFIIPLKDNFIIKCVKKDKTISNINVFFSLVICFILFINEILKSFKNLLQLLFFSS